MGDWAADFSEWVKRPYREDMSVVGWFAFLGLLIFLLALWGWFINRLN